MKYILMMNTMRAGQGVPEWPKKDLQAHIAFMMSLNKGLRESGEWRKTVARSSPSDELRDLVFPTLATLLRFGFRCGKPNTLCAGIHEPGTGG